MINVMCLNHPQTIPLLPIHGLKKKQKLSFTKPVPGAKKIGDYWIRGIPVIRETAWKLLIWSRGRKRSKWVMAVRTEGSRG